MFDFPVKAEIVVLGKKIGVCWGSLTVREVEKWIEIESRNIYTNLAARKIDIIKMVCDRLPKNENAYLPDFEGDRTPENRYDWLKDIPEILVDEAYELCLKELNKWEEPKVESEKKQPIGTSSTTDSIAVTPTSIPDTNLTIPQSI